MRFQGLIGSRFTVVARSAAMLSLTALAACDTEDQLAKQRLDAVKRERAMLAALSDAVKRGDLKADGTTASLFISSGMVNQAFAGPSGVKVELPNTSGAILIVDKIAADFRTGFPGLILDAVVEGSGVRISVSIVALLDVAPDDANPDALSLKVHIDSLVPAAVRPAAAANAVVLVVDDDPAVRIVIVDLLDDCGYTVLQADDGRAALRILESGARVDVLLTDVGLPRSINGRHVGMVRLRRTDLKILFVTGYAEAAAVGNCLMASGMEVMTKPFAVDALALRVNNMVGEPSVETRLIPR